MTNKSTAMLFHCNKPEKKKVKFDYQVFTFQIPADSYSQLRHTVQLSLMDYKKVIMHFTDKTLEFTEI